MKLIRVTQASAASLLLTAALAGCAGGGSGDDEPAGATTAAPSGAPAGAPTGAPMSGPPGTFGEIADVKGRIAQVQNGMTGQVAVSWTDDTTFTEEVDASFDDVSVGTCVAVTDQTVRITEECDQPADLPSDMPTELPSDMPTDLPERVMATVGEVTAVSATGFTVQGLGDEEVDVDVTDDTTFTTTADATADAVEVGRCLSAQGETDDTGAVTAATISVSDPVDGACSGGFAMRGPRP